MNSVNTNGTSLYNAPTISFSIFVRENLLLIKEETEFASQSQDRINSQYIEQETCIYMICLYPTCILLIFITLLLVFMFLHARQQFIILRKLY